MKAVRIHKFGGPEVLNIEDMPVPVPAADEILVKVFASGVNPVDWVVRNGGNDLLRSFLTLPMTPGWDAAGIIEDMGSAVIGFNKGDAVYGSPNFPGDGSYAGYVAGKASQFAIKPVSIDFTTAAAVPLAGLTAWTGLFAYGNLQPGQRILIQGASGGVGGFAVQLAKAKGAYVIGMASTGNLDYVKELGADEVIDYTTERFEDVLQELDIVLEASPTRDNNERLRSVNILKKGGVFVSVNVDFPFNDAMTKALKDKGVTGELARNQPRQDWLQEIARLIDERKVKVLVSRRFSLEDVAKAHIESQTWHTRGKIVLEIRNGQA